MRIQPGETGLRKQEEEEICKVVGGIAMGIEKATGEVTGEYRSGNARVKSRAQPNVFPSVGRAFQLVPYTYIHIFHFRARGGWKLLLQSCDLKPVAVLLKTGYSSSSSNMLNVFN